MLESSGRMNDRPPASGSHAEVIARAARRAAPQVVLCSSRLSELTGRLSSKRLRSEEVYSAVGRAASRPFSFRGDSAQMQITRTTSRFSAPSKSWLISTEDALLRAVVPALSQAAQLTRTTACFSNPARIEASCSVYDMKRCFAVVLFPGYSRVFVVFTNGFPCTSSGSGRFAVASMKLDLVFRGRLFALSPKRWRWSRLAGLDEHDLL